jgi:hypothetical protein
LASRDDLALVPGDAQTVFMLNLKQARGAKLWQRLLTARDKDPSSRKEYADFVAKCKLDPLADLDSFFLAVPAQAQQSREYAILLRGRYSPEAVVACLQKSAADRQQTVSEAEYAGIRLYSVSSVEGAQLAVLGTRAIVVAGPTWIRQVIDLHNGKAAAASSARENGQLKAMLGRTRVGDTAWWAGQVPPAMADRLRAWPQLGPAGSLHSVSGSLNLASGLAIHADLDLGSDGDASTLASSSTAWLAGLKQDSKVQLIGLASYLDTIQIAARQSTFILDIHLTDPQIEDLSTRLAGLTGLGKSLGGL